MLWRLSISTRTVSLFPYTPLFRAACAPLRLFQIDMSQMRDQLGKHGHDDPEADHVDDDGGQHDRYGAIGKAHRNSGKERPTRLRPVPENGNDAIHGSASPFRHPGLVPGSNAPTACHRVLKIGRAHV